LGVQMLADGSHVAIAIGIEPGPQLQAWRLEPQTGSTELVLADAAGKRLSFAPDGGLLAYLGYEIGPPRARGADVSAAPRRKSSVVWLADARHTEPWASPWRAPLDADEELVDLSWSPMADRLLIVSRGETAPDVVRSRGWLLEPSTGQADQVFTLPSEVVPGTVGWSPNGQALAFVAHAGQVNALCVLRLPGGFRYLADLETTPKPPLGMAPVEWSPDGGRIAFVAPPQRPPDAVGWPQAEPVHLTYVAGADDLVPVAAGDAGLDTVAWREDGQIVGLGREGGDGRLALKLVSAAADQSSTQVLARLPLHPSDRYAAGWALEQGRLVLVTQSAISEELEYWLISLATEVVR
jgi:dipeptidyl aminopeptidase/acylaminoacyl peptidase